MIRMESVDLIFPLPPSRRVARWEEFEKRACFDGGGGESGERFDCKQQLLKRGADWIPALPLSSLLLHLARGLGDSQSGLLSSHTF